MYRRAPGVVRVIRSGRADGPRRDGRDRGQIVLVAAAVVAVALLAMTFAYAQLGYDADRNGTGTVEVASLVEMDRSLTAAFRATVRDVEGEYRWAERERAVDRVRASLAGDAERLERANAEESRSLAVAFDDAAAAEWAREACPGGADHDSEDAGRAFGPCRAIDGVVVQERAGEATVVAAAIRIRIVSPAESTTATAVLRVRG
jgi:hypothetical protein